MLSRRPALVAVKNWQHRIRRQYILGQRAMFEDRGTTGMRSTGAAFDTVEISSALSRALADIVVSSPLQWSRERQSIYSRAGTLM